jgi:hypothetical protein
VFLDLRDSILGYNLGEPARRKVRMQSMGQFTRLTLSANGPNKRRERFNHLLLGRAIILT